MADFEKPWNTKNETSGRIRHQNNSKIRGKHDLEIYF